MYASAISDKACNEAWRSCCCKNQREISAQVLTMTHVAFLILLGNDLNRIAFNVCCTLKNSIISSYDKNGWLLFFLEIKST